VLLVISKDHNGAFVQIPTLPVLLTNTHSLPPSPLNQLVQSCILEVAV
jgi:hypothetical protein